MKKVSDQCNMLNETDFLNSSEIIYAGVVDGRSMINNPFQKGGVRVGMGGAFACATTFPHYAVQHGSTPHNVVG